MTLKGLTIFILLMLLFSGVQAKRVCIVKSRKDADICVNVIQNRAIADYVVVLTKKRYKTSTKVWVITDWKGAELKVYFSDTPEKTKIFISKNESDGI